MSIDFLGNGAYIEDSDGETGLIGLSAITFSSWIKSNQTGTDSGWFICESPNGSDSSITVRYDQSGANGGGTNVIKIGITTTTDGDVQLESSSFVQTTDLQHILFRWSSGNNIRLWINGIEDTPTAVDSGSGTITDLSTVIIGKGGKDTGSGDSWDGIVEDVRIYSRILSLDEITTLYNSRGIDSILNGIVFRYPFSEESDGSSFSIAHDIGPNKRDAVASNNPQGSGSFLRYRRRNY